MLSPNSDTLFTKQQLEDLEEEWAAVHGDDFKYD